MVPLHKPNATKTSSTESFTLISLVEGPKTSNYPNFKLVVYHQAGLQVFPQKNPQKSETELGE